MQFFNLTKPYYGVFACLLLSSCALIDNTPDDVNEAEQSVDTISQEIIALAKLPNVTEPSLVDNNEAEGSIKNDGVVTNTLEPSSLSLYQRFLAEQTKKKNNFPENALGIYNKATLAMKNKQWENAERLIDELLVIAPETSSAYVNKALIYYHQKKYKQAIAMLNMAENLSLNNPYIHNLKGVIYRELGELELAESNYLKAITIWPEYAQAYLNIAVFTELYRGDFEQAKLYYQTYLSFKPEDKQAVRWLAGLEIKLAAK